MSTVTSIHGRRLGVEVGTDDLVVKGGIKKSDGTPVALTPRVPTHTVANAPTTHVAGTIIYVSNGLAGDPCLAVSNGTNWISPVGTTIAAT